MNKIIIAAGVAGLASTAMAQSLPAGFDFVADIPGVGNWVLSENPGDWSMETGPDGTVTIVGGTSIGGTDWTFDLAVPSLDTSTTRLATIAAVNSAFTVTNNNPGVQNFTVTTMVGANVTGPTEILGSHSGNVGDNPLVGDGATLSAQAGSSMYDALIDGGSVQTLFNDPFSVVAPGFGTNAYGPGNYGFIGSFPAVTTSIAIVNQFSLTGNGDNTGQTSTFVVRTIPAPASLATVGILTLVGARRRR